MYSFPIFSSFQIWKLSEFDIATTHSSFQHDRVLWVDWLVLQSHEGSYNFFAGIPTLQFIFHCYCAGEALMDAQKTSKLHTAY